MIKVANLSKTYPHQGSMVQALANINLSVCEGEIVTILGPSGCGKTTLLRIIAGLLLSSQGTVKINGLDPPEYRRDFGIGFVFQKPVLFPWRTVMENILLPAEINNNHEKPMERALALVHMIGLRGFENLYPDQLSAGMAQRAAVARAILNDPKLLLLDEPFSSLDDVTREQLWLDLARAWEASRSTVLLVTHSIREAVFFGQRVLLMSSRPGQIREEVQVPFATRCESWIVSREFVDRCEQVRKLVLSQ